LSKVESFVNTKCPKCGGSAKRETETMDTFVESSWYYARYTCPDDDKNGIDKKRADYWLPVDQYIGGIEHACMHLLYARFFHKVLRDMGYLSSNEPATNLLTQGMVIKDGSKMSKSLGNVVDPDYIIEKYGADTARMFMLFASPPEKDIDWNDKGVEGCHRFISRVWRLIDNNLDIIKHPYKMDLQEISSESKKLRNLTHKTIKKVTEDLDAFGFNTSISFMMELVNELYKLDVNTLSKESDKAVFKETFNALVLMLCPFAPHTACELWELMGNNTDAAKEAWPAFDTEAVKDDKKLVVIQVNGKLRGKIEVPVGTSEENVKDMAFNEESVKKHLEGKEVKKVIYVEGKLLSIAVSGN